MNYKFTRNYFHSEFGYNSEFRSLNYIELIDENTKKTLNVLGNCYACNKPGLVKRDYNRGQRKKFNCYNCDK